MAFWGVELRPGTPYTHRYHPSRGRLRISKAALVSCDAATRTLVQCTLGNRTPLILCSLNPRLAEMCHLDVEFEEDVNVLFSVLGPSSVHLSGYYLRSSISNINIALDQQSSESYEEDIEASDSEYVYESEEESYESDFIDDGDLEVSDKNYVFDSIDDGDVCPSPDHHKQAFELQRRLGKKHPADYIDDSPYMPTAKRNPDSVFYSSSSSEDEVFYTRSEIMESLRLSFSLSNKSVGKGSQEIKPENVMSNDEMEKESNNARKRKCDAINHDPAAPTEVTEVNGSAISEREVEKQKKSKKTPLEPEDGKHSNIRTLEDGVIIEDLSAGNRDAKVASKGNKFMMSMIGMCVGGKKRLTIPPSLWRHRC